MITPKYPTVGTIKLWDGNKKHMKITNKGDQSWAKERLEWIMGLMRATDGGQRSQGWSDFHHPVYWCWAEMSKGIKPAGGKNKINAAVETLCTSFPVYRHTKEWSCQHPSHHHPCMYASLCASYLIHILLTWVLLFQLILFLKSSTAEPEGSLSPPFYSPHSRSLAMVTRRRVRCGVVRVIISFAAFRDALLHFNSSPIYFANPSYLWVNVYGAKCCLSALGCFLSFPRPCQSDSTWDWEFNVRKH